MPETGSAGLASLCHRHDRGVVEHAHQQALIPLVTIDGIVELENLESIAFMTCRPAGARRFEFGRASCRILHRQIRCVTSPCQTGPAW